ncbi:MAG: prepilin-type N-terminal cleavage/methylation domain-containing protein [Campylobacter sp.]|uniref:type II secretion system protein n=1 Tax=Campylobacter sp. TaxID=205 RepID=UPI002AA907B7|nr:prepilin-type N-terminal cleavage/methylation domain-containing protein [Campylobacter sp.]MCI7246440.1 prepilin-type N-terminal cleavage/methylation domain-containing protein [Campylobacter sp.]
MKKGFTMIELIFVIVILGILASVAIPRLAATKEDAEISAGIANIRTLLSDVASYYVVKGDFTGAKWRDFTNVPLVNTDATVGTAGGTAYLAVGGKNCLQVGMFITNPFILLKPVEENNNGACATFLTSAPIKQLLDSTIPAIDGDDDRRFCQADNAGCIEITSGSIYETKANNTGNQTQTP